ncbi:nineteen complex-related protein 2-domain-containing protein [Gymnopilus junonius]|uniref:Nineteen complex-related protein 2-domain-containing protein n=1 Tax=Gymnopilus junonius TaxID=109634 RepID=A0A9P5NEN6_GYMJU|nr:nineteen complex-related protein 2-domain-containing protein [Gymnopilus junonius]
MASESPVIFKRSKAKPTPRARQASPENETAKADASETAQDSPTTLALKLKNRVKKTKTKSRLSFGGDDEEEGDGEVFKVKKSSLSKKVSLGIHPATMPSTLDQATISANDTPRYDAAYLRELKANTPSARPPRPSNIDPYEADMSMDVGDVSIQSIEMEVEETTSFIPSESSIKVAKEKRERLRKTQLSGEEDFISLSVTKREEGPQGPHPESRFMREEDELGEGDDGMEFRVFCVWSALIQLFTEFAEYTSAQERIALGKKSRKIEASQRRDAMKELIADAEEEDEETIEWEQEQLRRGGHRTPEPSSAAKVKQVYKPAPTQEREEVDQREQEMREMVEKAEEKRAWFTSFKDWTDSVAEFLEEKYPLLEELEKEHYSLLKERYDMIAKRRREDNEDDLAIFIGSLPFPPSTEPEEVDEEGRTVPKPDPIQEQRERRVARVSRRHIRSTRRQRPAGEEEEGYSTDSSLAPEDTSSYTDAIQSIKTRRKEVLADVKAEEFRDPGKGRWSIWREKYSDSYIGAWGGWALSVSGSSGFKWYKGLYEYCRPGEGIVEERSLGPDGDLVASMISTLRMIDLAEEIEASIEPENNKFQSLLKSVMTAFDKAVSDNEASITKYTSSHGSLPGFNPTLKNLLRWRKYGKERFGLGMLVTRLVERCILVVAETGWEAGGEETMRTVVKMLPDELVSPQLGRFRGHR